MSKEPVSFKQKKIESDQDEQIKIYLENRYGDAIRYEKRHADKYSEVGLPDISISLYGMSIQIEDKVPGEFPRNNQLQKLNEYKDSGAIVFWCDSFKMFLSKWEEYVEGDPRVKFLKANYSIPNKARPYRFLDYIKSQEEDREKWMQIYKKEGLEIKNE